MSDPAPTPAPPRWVLSLKDLGTFTWLAVLTFSMTIRGCTPPVPPGPPPAPPAAISIPATLTGEPGRMVRIEATTDSAYVRWWCDAAGDLAFSEKASKTAMFTGPTGKYRVLAWTVDKKGKPTPAAECMVTIGTPVPPVPPVPPHPPVPPAPIPSDGFRVLIVYDVGALNTYKPGQIAALMGTQVRQYLAAKCAKGADGKTPEFRILDKGTDMKNEAKIWQDFMAVPHASVPWLFAANGDKGASMALPDTVEETMKVLQDVGGK